jgi:hypothetical protein
MHAGLVFTDSPVSVALRGGVGILGQPSGAPVRSRGTGPPTAPLARSRQDGPLAGRSIEGEDGPRRAGPLATVPGCTWYFRPLLKGTIAGVIVGPRSLSEGPIPDGPKRSLGLRSRGPVSDEHPDPVHAGW